MAARVARRLLQLLAALQLAGGTMTAAPAARPPPPRGDQPPLLLPLLPGVDLEMSAGRDSVFLRLVLRPDDCADGRSGGEARKKSSSFSLMPLMMLGSMLSYGMFPFMFANLNMLVMKAVMMNNMVLGMALFNTIRDVVFGPKPGPKVVYKNYGYRRRRPTPAHRPQHVLEEGPFHDVAGEHLDRGGPGGRGSPIPLGSRSRDHEDRAVQRLSAGSRGGGDSHGSVLAGHLPQKSFAGIPEELLAESQATQHGQELIGKDDAKYPWEVLQPPGMQTFEVDGPSTSSKSPTKDHS